MSTVPPADDFLAALSQASAEELYEQAPCGYVSTTPAGLIVKANATFANWLGYRADELAGRLRFADLLSVGGRIFYETHFDLLLRLHGRVNEIALDLTDKNGRIIPSLITGIQKRSAEGVPVANWITIFNATERRRYEQELLLAKNRAEDAAAELVLLNSQLGQSNSALLKLNEELGQFAYAASHDLQEPLRTITTYAQLLARRYDQQLDEHGRVFIDQMVESSRRMQSLISDLLAFSQAQGSPLVLRPVNLETTLDIAISNLALAIRESDAVLSHDKLPVLTADAARIAQVFQNLIGNSIKYRRQEEPPRVHVSCTINQEECLVSVKDNGLGFDNRYADQIFGMFKRLHGRDIPGTGIGLAICKKIIESHSGRIWAQSAPGSGSSFFFTIPTLPESSAA